MHLDIAAEGYAMCIIDSGADHADLTDDYAAVPGEMKLVAELMGGNVLSETDEREFYGKINELRKKAGDRAVMRAMHYYDDSRRAYELAEAIEYGDFAGFLSLVRESGRSSYMLFQNVDTYRNPAYQPVAFALALAEHRLAGEGAVRVHGGGFAGTIQAYVSLSRIDDFRRSIDSVLGDGACKVLSIRPVGGVALT